MPVRPNWSRISSFSSCLKVWQEASLWAMLVIYWVIFSFFSPSLQGHQKAWKVRAQIAPASLSCVPQAAFIWKTNTSSTNSAKAFPSPSLLLKDQPAPSCLSPPQPAHAIRADDGPERKLTGGWEDSVYSIGVSRRNIKRNWTAAKMFSVAHCLTDVWPPPKKSFENISLTLEWCSFVRLCRSCGLVMFIPEIFHDLSRRCF